MKIGIEFLYAQTGMTQGYDSSLRNLLKGLDTLPPQHEIFVFCTSAFYEENVHKLPHLRLVNCGDRWRSRLGRAVWLTARAPALIRRIGLDVMYFPTHFRPLQGLGRVRTVFNLYDLQYLYFRGNFPPAQRLIRHLFYRLSLAKSDRSICISEFVRTTVPGKFPSMDADRLVVIPIPVTFDEPADKSDAEPRFSFMAQPYLLSVGKHLAHKNFDTLIRAFHRLVTSGRYQGGLVVAGGFTKHTDALKALTRELGIGDRVHLLGYVNDRQREELYRSAELFVFPSEYEGFGMPPIEAMGRGVPVVSSDSTSLPEVTLGMAKYYSPARDAGALAEAIASALEHRPSVEALEKTAARVRQEYNIGTVAQQYVRLWESLAGQSPSVTG